MMSPTLRLSNNQYCSIGARGKGKGGAGNAGSGGGGGSINIIMLLNNK
jgi:hypothetical protein